MPHIVVNRRNGKAALQTRRLLFYLVITVLLILPSLYLAWTRRFTLYPDYEAANAAGAPSMHEMLSKDAKSMFNKANAYPSPPMIPRKNSHLTNEEANRGDTVSTHISNCTDEQLQTILQQLPPDDCIKYENRPHLQRCSHTYATKCPDAVWLEDYYTKLHSRHLENNDTPRPFVGIFVGCNKGMDAINALRMGSGNAFFDKNKCRKVMTKGKRKHGLGTGVCGQVVSPQFELPGNDSATEKMPSGLAQLHCIEPSPQTYTILRRTATELGYLKQGFKVKFAALSKEDGVAHFPNTRTGKESKGLADCNHSTRGCEAVPMHSLDTYAKNEIPPNVQINLLSIDAEGFDMDVLLGGSKSALHRVQYLEFEYNWMGSWKDQKLSDLIRLLDEQFAFTCYWPGFDRSIWRITGCFLDHYNVHFWSNVACVNRRLEEAREIATSMEQMFMDTLNKGDKIIMKYDNRFKVP